MLVELCKSMRPNNVAMAIITAFISYTLSSSWNMDASKAVILCLACGLLVGSQNLFNDCMDIKIDQCVKPWRSMACGKMSPRKGLIWSMGLTALSLLMAALLGISFFIFLSIIALGLVLYSTVLKRVCGVFANIFLSALAALYCLVGSVITQNYLVMGAISISIFFLFLGREVAMDIEDMSGDRVCRRYTLPMIVGKNAALLCATCCFILQILSSYLPYILHAKGITYAIIITLCNIAIIIYLLPSKHRQCSSVHNLQFFMKMSMNMYMMAYIVS